MTKRSKDTEYIIPKFYPKYGPAYCAELLGCSYTAACKRAQQMGIRMDKEDPWTPERLELLSELYPSTTAEALVSKIGLSVSQIRHKVHELGIKKRRRVFREQTKHSKVAQQLANNYLRGKI